MKKYTLTSYEPIAIDLPGPKVPESLVDAQVEKLLEPLARDTTRSPRRAAWPWATIWWSPPKTRGWTATPPPTSCWSIPLYHVGGGEMPRTFDEAVVGMSVGETKDAEAKIKMPLAQGRRGVAADHAGDRGEDTRLPHARG